MGNVSLAYTMELFPLSQRVWKVFEITLISSYEVKSTLKSQQACQYFLFAARTRTKQIASYSLLRHLCNIHHESKAF